MLQPTPQYALQRKRRIPLLAATTQLQGCTPLLQAAPALIAPLLSSVTDCANQSMKPQRSVGRLERMIGDEEATRKPTPCEQDTLEGLANSLTTAFCFV